MKDVIVIFDLGKTNKKVLVFDKDLRIIHQSEQVFPETKDDDGFECDDKELIETWIIDSLEGLSANEEYRIKAVNFSTYGATLMYIDETGEALTPVYNYLKPMPENITAPLYEKYDGVEEFCRRTASPALGFLNSGLQILWLKKTKPEVFKKVKNILHFPQYCSHILTGIPASEYTSIGCHTAMWDYDKMKYHSWLEDENIKLPDPIPNSSSYKSKIPEFDFEVGIGIHDSSASLAPYIMASKEKFVLLSTGTWCINMNPYNYEPLSREELDNDCLSYMSINQKPVKSSRFFMGHIHDVNLERLNSYFEVDKKAYKKVKADENIVKDKLAESKFFKKGMPENFIDNDVDLSLFESFEDAYHQLMVDLTKLCANSIKLILNKEDDIKNLYVTGGFSKNEIFLSCLANIFRDKKIYTSEIDNATALGAALVVYDNIGKVEELNLDLGLKKWESNN